MNDIHSFYTSIFKARLSQLINDVLYDQICQNFGFKPPQNSEELAKKASMQSSNSVRSSVGPFTKTPDFLVAHYNIILAELIDRELMPKFLEKFKLPKEQEWDAWLCKHMPLYKQSSPKHEERKMPFDDLNNPDF